MPLTRDEDIVRLLESTRTIAMVGASPRPGRASNGVMRYLQHQGYRVIPVNPTYAGETLHGERVLGALADIDEPIDMVDVFRRSIDAGRVIDEAVRVGATSVWTQLGVRAPEAEALAEEAGLVVVVDRCPKIEIPRLGLKAVKSQ